MIAIVGGGITGLAAAYELTERRVPFQLFESSARLGGIIRTEHVDGFTIEAGPDSILAQKPAAIGLCEAIGLGPRLMTTTPPMNGVRPQCRWRLHALLSPSVLDPDHLSGALHYDLLSACTGAARRANRATPRHDRDESVGAFFRRDLVTTVKDREPLLGGIHAGEIEALDPIASRGSSKPNHSAGASTLAAETAPGG